MTPGAPSLSRTRARDYANPAGPNGYAGSDKAAIGFDAKGEAAQSGPALI